MKLHCQRCAHDWDPRYPTPPKVCPVCKRPDWNVRKKRKLSQLEELVQRRVAAGFKQQVMAERVGVSLSHISRMERGDYKANKRFYAEYNALPVAK